MSFVHTLARDDGAGLPEQTFSPAVGDQMGVSVLGIDYDNGALEWGIPLGRCRLGGTDLCWPTIE